MQNKKNRPLLSTRVFAFRALADVPHRKHTPPSTAHTASPENVQKHWMLSRIGLSWKAAGAVVAVGTAAYSFVRHREQRSAEFLDKYWWNSAALIVADEDGHLHRDKNPPFVGTHGFNSDELLGRDAYSSLERMYDYHHSSQDTRFKNEELVSLRWETADQLEEALQATAAAPAALWVMTERQAAQCQEIELPLRFQRFSQGRDLADAKFDAVDLYSGANSRGVNPDKPATPSLTLLDARVHQRPGTRFGDFPECDHDAFAPMLAQAVAATTVNRPAAAIDVLVTNEAVPGQALVETHARAGVGAVVFLAKPWQRSSTARKLHGTYSRAVDAVRARAASSTELALPECVLVDSVSVDSLRESHPELWIDSVNHASATAIIEASKPKKTALVDARDTGLRKVDRKISALMQGPNASGDLYYFSPFDGAEARATREAEALAEQTQQDGVDNLIFGCDHSNIRAPNAAREYRDALRRRGAPADRQQRLYVVKEGDDGIRGYGRDYFAKGTTGIKSYDEETNTFRVYAPEDDDL